MSQNVAKWQSSTRAGELMRSALLYPLQTNVALILSLTATFTVSDAFETASLGLLHSVCLWLVVSVLMVLQTYISHRFFLALFSKVQFSQSVAIGFALMATVILMTVELHWLKFTPLLPKEPDPFFEFILFVAQPVLAVGCLTLIAHTTVTQQYLDQLRAFDGLRREARDEKGELESVLATQCVLRVSAQDHYLEIVCAEEKHMLRGRMRDALSLLADHKGVQIHRSHWVAHQHISKVLREGRDMRLLLNDGSELPVARSRVQAVKLLHNS